METSWSKMSRQAVCIVLKCESTQLGLGLSVRVLVRSGHIQPVLELVQKRNIISANCVTSDRGIQW